MHEICIVIWIKGSISSSDDFTQSRPDFKVRPQTPRRFFQSAVSHSTKVSITTPPTPSLATHLTGHFLCTLPTSALIVLFSLVCYNVETAVTGEKASPTRMSLYGGSTDALVYLFDVLYGIIALLTIIGIFLLCLVVLALLQCLCKDKTYC